MDDQWVQLRTCGWLHEAHMIASVLEAEGIEVFLPDAHTLGVRPELANALGGVRVLVRASDLERANETLAAAIPADAGGDDDEQKEPGE